MTWRHLISFAYMWCPCVNFCPRLWSNLYFCNSQNSQKNLINSLGHIFVKYVKNPSLPSSKIIQQYSFSYSVQKNTFWRKYHFGMSKWYPFSTVLSSTQITILHQMSAQSIHYFEPGFNIRIYVQCGTLQSKYHLGSSFWAENLWIRSSY